MEPSTTKPDNVFQFSDKPWAMDLTTTSNFEAPKDPGALKAHSSITDIEILGHRNVFVGIHVPGSERAGGKEKTNGSKSSRSNNRSHRRKTSVKGTNPKRPVTPPAQRVQFILGEDHDENSHQSHPLFSEMEELLCDEDGEMEWKETARWIKFEEDVEEGGNRWSKPHVATLSLHSLFELRSMLLNGTICLDMAATSLEDICELTLDSMVNSNMLPFDKKAFVKDAILKKHRHQYEGDKSTNSHNMSKLPLIRSLAEIGRNHSSSKTEDHEQEIPSALAAALPNFVTFGLIVPEGVEPATIAKIKAEVSNPAIPQFQNSSSQFAGGHHIAESSPADMNRTGSEVNTCDQKDGMSTKNAHFMKKIPKGAEASNILVGELNALEKPLSAFIRLSEAAVLGDLTEVPVPTRFIFILLGPSGEDRVNVARYHEIGRAVATIMSDEVFHDVAYKAKKREHLLAGIDEFLDAVTVLPPGEWDPNIRIEPPQSVPSQESRKNPKANKEPVDEEEEEQKLRADAGLVRSGRLFGGLINDIKRKVPWYWSDFRDGISVQCLASYIFIYFACLTPIVTFGGLLGDATENRIAAIESLVSGFVVGVIYGLFSGQPLTIMGSTGPILVFETIMYDFCKNQGWEYLPFRLWTGVWSGVILLILVATDASAFVCYITRFTEENFACLIAFIFIKKAFEKTMHIGDEMPIYESPCYCEPRNSTLAELYGKSPEFIGFNATKPHRYPCEFTSEDGLTIQGLQSVGCHYHPNAFLMSCLLFFGTFLLSWHLKKFKFQSFFGNTARNLISDFAVIIAILTMTSVDYFVHVDTPKLTVPEELRPTWSGRGWIISPFGTNPYYTCVLAILPAILATILLFMDQQITAVIVNRKENKLMKGGGYHLDLFVVAILIVICSLFGLPWFVAATVLSINHVRSLTRESDCSAPGEKPQFLGIREQRLTHVLIFLTIGISVKMNFLLKLIPMPVLYGVFLYMGVASLNGIQFFDRILLFFMPKKYQPDVPYLRQVKLFRVHMFTCVQLTSLVCLWVVKDIKQTSIFFPIMLVVMMGVRKLLDFVFTRNELKILDDVLPEHKRAERLKDDDGSKSDEASNEERRGSLRYTDSGLEVPLANGNVVKIPLLSDQDINISEEVNRSGVWKSLEANSSNPKFEESSEVTKSSSIKKRKKRMSIVDEDDAEDTGITIKLDSKKSQETGTGEEMTKLVSKGDSSGESNV